MGEQMPDKPSGGYGSKWKKWLWIYLVVGAVAYVAIYLIWFRDGNGLY